MNHRRSARATAVLASCVAALLTCTADAFGQQPSGAAPPRAAPQPTRPGQPTVTSTNLPGHPSPPQPTQSQGLDYFVGTWNFSWTGRESPITAGPRSGTVTYTRLGQSNFLQMAVNGKIEDAGAYQESGIVGWNVDKKLLVNEEKVANGTELLSLGDWGSAISIRFDVQPVQAQGHTIRLRRAYAITSATSFSVTEDLSTDDGPFVRLGVGSFQKTP